MAKCWELLLLPLLSGWALAGERWLGAAEARTVPYAVKLCGREFIRAVIYTCGSSRWRRSDLLAREATGEVFPGAGADTDSLAGQPDEALSSSEWLALPQSPQALSRGRAGWQETPEAARESRDIQGGLSSFCCKWGCTKSQLSILC
ncbi:relaxin-3 [Lepus europaeus]|uniref:relaxin-3 n=1 Tax=Lepus europaeus TaxID=9983 RepID=UPI002B47B64D|nr:relaxin-3 [Lepus europaeus]